MGGLGGGIPCESLSILTDRMLASTFGSFINTCDPILPQSQTPQCIAVSHPQLFLAIPPSNYEDYFALSFDC